MKTHVQAPWSEADDEVLREAVSIHGPRAWSAIACGLPRRSSKDCRARWLVLEERRATEPQHGPEGPTMTAHVKHSARPKQTARGFTRQQNAKAESLSLSQKRKVKFMNQKAKCTTQPRLDNRTCPINPFIDRAVRRSFRGARMDLCITTSLPGQRNHHSKRPRLSPRECLEEVLSSISAADSVGFPSVDIQDETMLTALPSGQQVSIDFKTDRPSVSDGHYKKPEINESGTQIKRRRDKKARPPPLHSLADEYCAADEAFLQPRTPLLLKEIDAAELTSDLVMSLCAGLYLCHVVSLPDRNYVGLHREPAARLH